ncbi:MAG: hypothetical protein ISR95_03360 [Candidatus Marinimicrobia bacterium]|nr:hypothetical protein [Candidatus Neomarinimicrobiota bacterium]MBL7046656.1 hypothetical protein [Candidatus Neomarinimicrobiota bacterium]
MVKNSLYKKGLFLSLILLLVLGISAQEGKLIDKFETTVSLNFKGAKLIDILRLLAVQNNLNILFEDVKGEVTVSLSDVGLGTALDAILKVNGYDWFIQGNIIVVKPQDEEMTGELTTRVYKLEYADANSVGAALENVLTGKGKVQVFSPVAGGGVGGAGGARGGAGAAGAAGGALGGALGGGIASRGAVGGGIGGIGAFPDHLLVTDVLSNFPFIEKIIKKLDKQVPQINIAVKFIETSLKADERLGINWDLRSTLSGPAEKTAVAATELALGKWNSMRFATLTLPVFSAILEVLSSDNNTRLLQEPQVTTKDNVLATLTEGVTIPILVPQPQGGLAGTQPFTFEDQEISVTLSVQPRINEDKFVSMTVNIMVQSLVGYTPTGERPITSQRSAQTQVMVANGETLLMGGLIYDHLTKTETAVPFLGNLPLIKRFFTHKSTTTEQRELLIFITPNIVRLF